MRRRGLALAALLITATAACSAETLIPTSPTPTPTASPTASTLATPTITPSEGPEPSGLELPAVGQPFDGMTILAAMRDSRRPGGVPDQLETEAIASALADAIWTFDGRPWTTISVSGSCGPDSCTIELAGTRPDSLGDDVWIVELWPAHATAAVTTTDLRGLPNQLVPALDGLARSLLPAETLDGLLMTSARWLPPPDGGQFVLSYRGDGEEGSCALDLTLDAATPGVVGDPSPTC